MSNENKEKVKESLRSKMPSKELEDDEDVGSGKGKTLKKKQSSKTAEEFSTLINKFMGIE